MILVDNSDFSRDGDTFPNRLSAQLECAASITQRLNNQNQESAIGLLSTGNSRCEVLITPSNEPAAVNGTHAKVTIGGRSDILRGLQIAMLAMKHRVNKHQHERVILFVASKVEAEERKLMELAREIRRNNVILDIVNVCVEENLPILRKFHEAVSAGGEGKLLHHPGGPGKLLATVQSGLFEAAAPGARIEEDEDQDYLLAIQMSLMEQEKADKERETPKEKKMEVEEDSETAALLKKADDLSKNKEGVSPDNAYINDPEFIKEVIQDLNLDVDSEKIAQRLKKNLEEPKDPQDKEKEKDKEEKK